MYIYIFKSTALKKISWIYWPLKSKLTFDILESFLGNAYTSTCAILTLFLLKWHQFMFLGVSLNYHSNFIHVPWGQALLIQIAGPLYSGHYSCYISLFMWTYHLTKSLLTTYKSIVFVIDSGSCQNCLWDNQLHSKKKSTFEHLFWCFRLSQIEDSIQYLEGPNGIWKNCDMAYWGPLLTYW